MWKFQLVDGKCLVQFEHGCSLNEETWAKLCNEREAFMEPVWAERRKAADAKYLADYYREHNIQERTETFEGVEVIVTTQGTEGRISSIKVAGGEFPRIRTSRCMTGKSTSWNVEYFDPRVAAYSPHNPYATLRNSRGGAIAFKTPWAAILAGIRQEKLTEVI